MDNPCYHIWIETEGGHRSRTMQCFEYRSIATYYLREWRLKDPSIGSDCRTQKYNLCPYGRAGADTTRNEPRFWYGNVIDKREAELQAVSEEQQWRQ